MKPVLSSGSLAPGQVAVHEGVRQDPDEGVVVSGLGSGQAAHLRNPSGINGLGKSLGDVHRRALANGCDRIRGLLRDGYQYYVAISADKAASSHGLGCRTASQSRAPRSRTNRSSIREFPLPWP